MFTLEKGKVINNPKDMLFGLTNNGEDIPKNSIISIVLFKKEAVIESLQFDIRSKVSDIEAYCVKAVNRSEAESMVVTIFTKDFNKKPIRRRANLLIQRLSIVTHLRDMLYLSQEIHESNKITVWGSYMCSDVDCCPELGREIILAEGLLQEVQS